MYQPTLGRFLSRDPLGEGGVDVLYDNNDFGDRLTEMRQLYGYVSNNPVRYVDPSGLSRENPGWICIDPSCTSDFIITDEDGVYDRIAPGECCMGDGVWGVGHRYAQYMVDPRGTPTPDAPYPHKASEMIECEDCPPCKHNFFKVTAGCTMTVKCDNKCQKLLGVKGPVPYVSSIECDGFVNALRFAYGGGCVPGEQADDTPNRNKVFPEPFDPTQPIPARGTGTFGKTCGQKKGNRSSAANLSNSSE